jgi:hypothetical protein
MVRRNGSRVRCFTKVAQDAVASLTTRNAELAKAKPGKPVVYDLEAIRADAEVKAKAAEDAAPAPHFYPDCVRCGLAWRALWDFGHNPT